MTVTELIAKATGPRPDKTDPMDYRMVPLACALKAIAHEREACAVIAEDHECWRDNPAHSIASDIRARERF